MNKKLRKLILAYQSSVRTAVEHIKQSGIPLPITSSDWAEIHIPAHGELKDGITYYKHGYGCLVNLPSGSVEFDFGRMGEIDGFDSYRLINFAGARLAEYGFETENEIKESFDAAVKSGSLVASKQNLYYAAEYERTLAMELRKEIPGDLLPHCDDDEVLAVHAHGFLAADLMRENYKKLLSKLEKSKGLSQDEEVNFRIYFSSWLAYLYATCEGFEKIGVQILLTEKRPASFLEAIPKWHEVARLIKLHKISLRKFRHNIFHVRADVKPIMQFASNDEGRLSWAGELHSASAEFFSTYRLLCEMHYLMHERYGESQIRKQSTKKRA